MCLPFLGSKIFDHKTFLFFEKQRECLTRFFGYTSIVYVTLVFGCVFFFV